MEPTLNDTFASVTGDEPTERVLARIAPEEAVAAPSTESLEQVFDKVERAKQEWEASVDALTGLVCLVDEHGCIIRINRMIEQWQTRQGDSGPWGQPPHFAASALLQPVLFSLSRPPASALRR